MCGISGYIASSEIQHSQILKSLNHRGPDHQASFREVIHERAVYLGHNRLSILDLSENGHQPMVSRDGKVVLIYNGEIYNHKMLKRTYLRESTFISNTDTEVVLHLYEKFGIDFIHKLNGDFAIAILDKRHSKLYLVRDRFGVKPLYYAHKEGAFLFGSELKALLASRLGFELNKEVIHKYLVFKYVPGDETLFKGIKRVKPGHYLEYDIARGKVSIVEYWKLAENEADRNLNYDDAKQQLFELLQDATRIRLMSDVPVGTFFSGGLDSSTLAFFIKDEDEITHYSARKDSADVKKEGTTADFDYAVRLAREFNLNLHPIDIGDSEFKPELIRKTVFFCDDLIADGSQIPSYLITREASKTSKVLLSGMGADEIFLGYAGHLLASMSLQFDKAPQFVSLPVAKGFSKISQGRGWFKAYRRYLHKIGKYYRYPQFKYGLYTIVGDFENALSVYRNGEENVSQYISAYFPEDSDPFECIHHFEFENFLVKNLHYMDRMCMANSTEGRVPFLDHWVVELAYSLPRAYKLSNWGESKKILKDAMRPYLPGYILDRRKAGFGMPLRSLFSKPGMVWSLLDKKFFGDFDNFSVADIERLVENHTEGREDNASLIYALILFQEWYKLLLS